MNRIAVSERKQTRLLHIVAVTAITVGTGAIAFVGSVGATTVANKSKSCRTSTGVKITDQQVCKGLNYYRGKTISLIAGGNPGGSFDAVARTFQPELQEFLGATVNVVNNASPTAAQNMVAASQANGLTLGLLNCVPDAVGVATGNPVVNFNPAKVQMYGTEGANSDMYLVTKSSPFQSFGALINSTSASTPVNELSLASGYDTTVQLLVNASFGIHAHVITGYGNEAALVAGFNRGDGQLMFGPLTSTGPLALAGSDNPVAISRQAPAGNPFANGVANVPALAALETQFPAKTTDEKNARVALNAFIPAGAQVVFGPARTPSYLNKTLIAAMFWTVRTEKEKQTALLKGLTPGWQSPTKMLSTYKTMLRMAPTVRSVFTAFNA